MAKISQTTRRSTSKSRTRKTGGGSGYIKCNMCGGTGRIRNWRKK